MQTVDLYTAGDASPFCVQPKGSFWWAKCRVQEERQWWTVLCATTISKDLDCVDLEIIRSQACGLRQREKLEGSLFQPSLTSMSPLGKDWPASSPGGVG